MHPIETIRNAVRGMMNEIAKSLDEMSHGRIKPDHITYTSLLGHILVVAAILVNRFDSAALFLIAFGLLDSLDGALARHQKRKSNRGSVLDASTDKIKESMIYIAIVYVLAQDVSAVAATWAAAAVTGSLVVSYVRARGETALAKEKNVNLNQVFKDGLFSYEIRMFVLVLGLGLNRLEIAVIVVAVGAWLTAIFRLQTVIRALSKD